MSPSPPPCYWGSWVKSPGKIKPSVCFPIHMEPSLPHTLDGCWLVIVRTQRSRCASWLSSLPCCLTLSSSASSSSTWMGWWRTPWRCTKTGRWWTCGASRKRRLSERSKQFTMGLISLRLSKQLCGFHPAETLRFSSILNHFRFIQHPKNFGLIASFLERKVCTLGAFFPPRFFLLLLDIWVTNGISLFFFQTVAECVLFYYLTKKNENYKNIVRRNYRRRGRSQVFFQLLNHVCWRVCLSTDQRAAEKVEIAEHLGSEEIDSVAYWNNSEWQFFPIAVAIVCRG